MPRKRIGDAAGLIVAVALVAVLALLRSSQNVQEQSTPSTYDTGPNGYAALYDLLDRERTPVQRFELPISEVSGRAATLVIAGNGAVDAVLSAPNAARTLDRWVRGGGKLVLLDTSPGRAARDALGLPQSHTLPPASQARAGCAFVRRLRGLAVAGTFAFGYARTCTSERGTLLAAGTAAAGIAHRRGRGTIVAVSTPTVFDNLHIAQRANARIAYAVLGTGAVAFDERVHGYAAGRSFWEVLPQPVRVAVILAIAAALLAIAGANLPFAPPYEVAARDDRDTSAYLASLAHMLERGGAAGEAIARITARCEPALSARPEDERARMLLRELRTVEATPRPGPQDVLAAGRIFARVRKDYGC